MDIGAIEAGSRFLASTLHEVRTPIQTIISTTELLEDTALDKEQTEYVHQIEFSANALLQLANDVLDFTKIQSENFVLENIPYNIITLTEKVVDLISIDAFHRGIEVVTDIDYSIQQIVTGDPNRVQQIILNLVKNAVKFTEKGFIYVRLTQKNNMFLFEIADSGIGIANEKKKLIFKDFYQADSSTTRRFGGTGLGLSICKNLVAVMKGKIGVLSNPSGGSNFWFTIPVNASTMGNEKSANNTILEDTKILILEDNSLALNAMIKKIKYLGIKNYDTATTGSEALEKLKSAYRENSPFTITFIDHTIPDIDSWKLAETIKNTDEISGSKLYLMIPEGQMGKDAKLKMQNLYSGYIYKPIKKAQLEEVLFASTGTEEKSAEMQKTNINSAADLTIAKDNKILIAEDHPVNRKLLDTILKKFGATVFLAENGEEAVKQITEHPDIDIIFMDIFMPVKNGIDATVEIRHNNYKGIIIACTANNDPDDFKTYKELGINDILIKPFKKEAVRQTLEKWNSVLSIPEAKEIMTLIDINNQASDIWDINDFLDTTNGDKELAVTLMDEYVEQTQSILEKLKTELLAPKKDFEKIELYTHTIKGSSATVSAVKLSDYGKAMNEAAKRKDLISLEASRTDFALDFLRLKNFIKNWKSSL